MTQNMEKIVGGSLISLNLALWVVLIMSIVDYFGSLS